MIEKIESDYIHVCIIFYVYRLCLTSNLPVRFTGMYLLLYKVRYIFCGDLLMCRILNIEYYIMNAKDISGKTGFHSACEEGHVKIVELLIKDSVEFNFDLNAKDSNGNSGYHLACRWQRSKFNDPVIKLIFDNSAEFNIDLNIYHS